MTPSERSGRALPADWARLTRGDRLIVVKLRPDGAEATRYPGEVIAGEFEGWVVVRARWTLATIDLDGLTLEPGDELQEWFSPRHPFNAFAVFDPGGELKGWYANVTHPAWLETSESPWQLIWHDLYLDLVGFPDGRFVIRDDDELDDSELEHDDPALYRVIVTARTEMIRRFTDQVTPFASRLPEE